MFRCGCSAWPILFLFLWTLHSHAEVRGVKPRSPNPRDLLLRVLLAEDQVPFSAIQTVIIPVGESTQATVSRERFLGNNRSRIEFSIPKSIAGRMVVNDGRWQWEYDPATKRAVRSGTKWRPMTRDIATQMRDRVLRTYSATVSPTDVDCSGRRAYVLHLTPHSNDRQRQVWWVDLQTFLVLRRQVYDSSNKLHSMSSYAEVRILSPIEQKEPVWTRPAGSTVITRNESNLIASHSEAHHLVPAWVKLMKSLGRGFDFECVRLVRANKTQTAHAEYSDGLTGVSLIQVPENAIIPAGDQPVKGIVIGNILGRITRQSRYTVLSWSAAGSTFSLIADLPDNTLKALALALTQ